MNEHDLVKKFGELEAEIAAQQGDFVLFALFLREDAFDRWDLMLSAPWLGSDQIQAVKFIVAQIKAKQSEQVLTSLSNIIVADPAHAAVKEFNQSFPVEHGSVELRDRHLFGVPVQRAYVITSKQPSEPRRATA